MTNQKTSRPRTAEERAIGDIDDAASYHLRDASTATLLASLLAPCDTGSPLSEGITHAANELNVYLIASRGDGELFLNESILDAFVHGIVTRLRVLAELARRTERAAADDVSHVSEAP